MRLAVSSSSSYGLVVHLLLLPTPPHGDAVSFGYKPESVCLKGTLTPLTLFAFSRTTRHLPVAVLWPRLLREARVDCDRRVTRHLPVAVLWLRLIGTS